MTLQCPGVGGRGRSPLIFDIEELGLVFLSQGRHHSHVAATGPGCGKREQKSDTFST